MSTDGADLAFARPESDSSYGSPGLTKREYFAAGAMKSLLMCEELRTAADGDAVAIWACGWADRLIAALNAKGEDENAP